MKNPVLKRRLNPFLLATTVLVLSLLAGLSVMYQGQLSDILSDKKDLQENLEEKRNQVSNLQAENANLTQEIEQKERRLNNLSSESQSLESEVESLNNEVDTLEARNSNLQDEVIDLENKTKEINESLELVCKFYWENISEGTYTREECVKWGHNFDED